VRRILILGNAGSGKSTLARALGAKLGLSVLHLDTIFWKPGWVESSFEEYDAKLAQFLEHDAWVIDGNNSRTMPLRFGLADAVIVLDLPVWISLYRVLKRHFQYRGRSRPDITEGCNEKIDLGFLQWILIRYPKRNRPKNLTLLEQARQAEKQAILLRSGEEVKAFLLTLETELEPAR
jgi:adenylate kinase family enzyme